MNCGWSRGKSRDLETKRGLRVPGTYAFSEVSPQRPWAPICSYNLLTSGTHPSLPMNDSKFLAETAKITKSY